MPSSAHLLCPTGYVTPLTWPPHLRGFLEVLHSKALYTQKKHGNIEDCPLGRDSGTSPVKTPERLLPAEMLFGVTLSELLHSCLMHLLVLFLFQS